MAMDVPTLISMAGSVGKLAARLGIAHNTVSDWKRTGFVPGNRLAQIAHEFNIPMEDLLPLVQKVASVRASQREAAV